MAEINRCQPLLGTFVDIRLVADADEETLHVYCNEAFAAIHQAQALMSFHDPDSELSSINRLEPNKPLKIHPWITQVLSFALELSAATDGKFDVTVGRDLVKHGLLPDLDHGQADGCWKSISLDAEHSTITLSERVVIDLGGIAKGFAVDQAMASLKNLPIEQAIINAGGDLKMLRHEGEEIHIRLTNCDDTQLARLPMLAQAAATSADSFRTDDHSSYIIDPQSHQCLSDSRSITIFAPECMVADALTKTAFLLPQERLDALLKTYHACAHILPAK